MALQARTLLHTAVPVIFIKQHPCWIKSFWVTVRGSLKDKEQSRYVKAGAAWWTEHKYRNIQNRSWHTTGWLEAAVFFFVFFFSPRVLEVGAEGYFQLTLGHFCYCWHHNERLASEMLVLDEFPLFHTKQQQWLGINCRIIVLIVFCSAKQEHH